jgi:uncharacterized protein (TIGR03437 family)
MQQDGLKVNILLRHYTSSVEVNTPVSFSGSATLSDCTGTVSYDLDFGDGSTHASEQNPTHTYSSPGDYTWTMTASAAGANACTRTDTITVTGAPIANFSAAGVVNAASYAGGAVAPCEIITIFGTGIGPPSLATMELTPDGQYVTNSLADTRVLFDGIPAPLVYVSATQVSAVTPISLAGTETTQVQIEYMGEQSDPVTLPVVPAAPGIFTLVPIGQGQGAILHWPDYSVNGPTNPAEKGSIIMVFATSGGLTEPPGEDGKLVAEAQFLQLPVTATIGGVPATVSYAGAAPTLVTGVLQINIVIPDNAPIGDSVLLVINVGGVQSQPGVTLAVH